MNEEFRYIHTDTVNYLTQFNWSRDELLLRLEREAKQEKIPIIQVEAIQLISQLARIKQPQNILEIGTAIGYSTIWLARAAQRAQVISLEIDERMVRRARENVAEDQLLERVHILHRDAILGLPAEYHGVCFDLIFIDASKAKYDQYLEIYLPLLAEEGLLITDNILFHGLVYGQSEDLRQAWIGEKLHHFNQIIYHHPLLQTTFYPIGDGLAISIKTKGETICKDQSSSE